MKYLLKILIKIKSFIVYCRFGRVYTNDTYGFNSFFFHLMKILHKKEYAERQTYVVDVEKNKLEENGFDKFDINKIFSKKSLESLQFLRNEFDKLSLNDDNQKKTFLKTFKIKLDDNISCIIDDLTPVVTNYMGCLPIVSTTEYWFSPNTENQPKRSQEFHTDGEDIKQVRVLIPINEITKDHGPLTLINAKKSYEVYKKLKKKTVIKKKTEKIADEIFFKFISKNEKNEAIVNSNEIYMVDTCRCYHYGSRKSKYQRKLISITFQTPFSIDAPIFNRKMLIDKFDSRKHQLMYSFLQNNFYYIRENYNLKKFQLKIL